MSALRIGPRLNRVSAQKRSGKRVEAFLAIALSRRRIGHRLIMLYPGRWFRPDEVWRSDATSTQHPRNPPTTRPRSCARRRLRKSKPRIRAAVRYGLIAHDPAFQRPVLVAPQPARHLYDSLRLTFFERATNLRNPLLLRQAAHRSPLRYRILCTPGAAAVATPRSSPVRRSASAATRFGSGWIRSNTAQEQSLRVTPVVQR